MPPCHTARISAGWARVVGGLVEQHVAQAAAEDHAEHAVEEQVVDLLGVPSAVRAGGGRDAAEHDEGMKATRYMSRTSARPGADGDGDGVGEGWTNIPVCLGAVERWPGGPGPVNGVGRPGGVVEDALELFAEGGASNSLVATRAAGAPAADFFFELADPAAAGAAASPYGVEGVLAGGGLASSSECA